jgi:hypothetical protein
MIGWPGWRPVIRGERSRCGGGSIRAGLPPSLTRNAVGAKSSSAAITSSSCTTSPVIVIWTSCAAFAVQPPGTVQLAHRPVVAGMFSVFPPVIVTPAPPAFVRLCCTREPGAPVEMVSVAPNWLVT